MEDLASMLSSGRGSASMPFLGKLSDIKAVSAGGLFKRHRDITISPKQIKQTISIAVFI